MSPCGIPLRRAVKRLAVALAWLFAGALPISAATLTVTNASDSGPGSLRQAILDANVGDAINFAMPGTGPFTITLTSGPLPPLPASAVLDGTTQAGYSNHPVVLITGTGPGASADGLLLQTGGTTVLGLAINGFSRDGIRIDGGSRATGGNVIQGNFIGADVTGTIAAGNTAGGVNVLGSPGNLIGGTNAQQRNVISGGKAAGIYLQFAASSSNVVIGNFIGTDAAGTQNLGNQQNGIAVLSGAVSNIIGGTTSAERNIISGNGQSGVYVYNGSAANIIQGNVIGTTVWGTNALPNAVDGVTILSAAGNLVGGTNTGAGNLISGNLQRGVQITGAGATSNLVRGNFIGTDVTGRFALANHTNGVAIGGVPGNVIGGTVPAARNVISGNFLSGLYITTAGAVSNLVQGNYVGVDVTGTNAMGNSLSGITIDNGGATLIGGTTPGAGNVIGGNANDGVFLSGVTTGNVVQGNFIGTDASGQRQLANIWNGIEIQTAGNVIGGAPAGAGNVISANSSAGIKLIGSGATGNQFLGNLIGTDASGQNALGNASDGIAIYNAATNTVGGAAAGAGNVISGNGNGGIYLTNAPWTVIQGNVIGTRSDGTGNLGNVYHGVEVEANSGNTTIGGTAVGAGNRVANARSQFYAGVRVRDGSRGVLISGNSIYNNGGNDIGLGIDLGPNGVNANDPCEQHAAQSKANNLQNYPVLTLAYSGGCTGVKGSLNSAPNTTYLLEFFANPACDPSGYGEGAAFLGQAIVTTGGSCSNNFTATLNAAVAPGQVITATATDPANNTSEFSACVTVAAPPLLTLTSITNAPGGNPQFTLSWPTSAPGFVLKQTTDLTPPVAWTTVTNVTATNGGLNLVTLSSGGGNRFFRLSFE
jgi:hypothetical protein